MQGYKDPTAGKNKCWGQVDFVDFVPAQPIDAEQGLRLREAAVKKLSGREKAATSEPVR